MTWTREKYRDIMIVFLVTSSTQEIRTDTFGEALFKSLL